MASLAVPSDFTPEEIERGRLFFASPIHFLLGAEQESHLPPPFEVEIAFAGRSNVGKSSLFNALVGQKSLARTSNTPGRTRQLNFFSHATRKIALVDLPGYGYAQVERKQYKRWQSFLFAYLRGRVPLKRVFLLIDSRHGFMRKDFEILDLLDSSAVMCQVVLTKSDKISAAEREHVISEALSVIDKNRALHPRLHITSKETLEGISLLRAEWASFL